MLTCEELGRELDGPDEDLALLAIAQSMDEGQPEHVEVLLARLRRPASPRLREALAKAVEQLSRPAASPAPKDPPPATPAIPPTSTSASPAPVPASEAAPPVRPKRAIAWDAFLDVPKVPKAPAEPAAPVTPPDPIAPVPAPAPPKPRRPAVHWRPAPCVVCGEQVPSDVTECPSCGEKRPPDRLPPRGR